MCSLDDQPPEIQNYQEEYKGCSLEVRYIRFWKDGWMCVLCLPDGTWLQRLESHTSLEDVLQWGKKLIDISDNALDQIKQADELTLEKIQPHLYGCVAVMVKKYFPKTKHDHTLLLKYLILQINSKGTIEFWEQLLAPALELTTRQLLNRCKDLVKAGLIRYSRKGGNSVIGCYLGPAWLNLEGVTLTSEELGAIAKGEEVASYQPWGNEIEQYPGEKCGWPNMEENHMFSVILQEKGMKVRWVLRHEGNALVRVPTKQNNPKWYSTWSDGLWTHRASHEKENA